jgi:inner membrane protein
MSDRNSDERHGPHKQLGRGNYAAILKIALLSVIALAFLVPLSMVGGLTRERQNRRNAAVAEVVSSWGGEQVLSAPVVVIPFVSVHVDGEGAETRTEHQLRVTAERLETQVVTDTQIRHRGIYEVPLYTASASLAGTFAIPHTDELDLKPDATVSWNRARVILAVGGILGLTERPVLTWAGTQHPFGGSAEQFASLSSTLEANLPGIEPGETYAFSTRVELRGGNSFRLIPVAAASTTTVSSDWVSPSFAGSMLPTSRSISDNGFTATWTTAALGLGFPSSWVRGEVAESRLYSSSFGVELYQPVDAYQKTSRSVKYGILFILLPFLTFFLFEVFTNERIHPVQYLLVGAAKVVFYLLLLSLSEHVPFMTAYAAGAVATTLIVTLYTVSIVRTNTRGWLILPVLLAEYTYLYTALSSEDYALVLGAVGLFAILAGVMLLTRTVDWYGAFGYSRRTTTRAHE